MLRWSIIVACACGSSSAPAPAKSGSGSAAPGAIVGECAGASCWTSVDGFRYLHPGPVGDTLRAVHVMPDGDAWIVGDDATLLRVAHGDHRVTRITVPDVPTLAAELDSIESGTSKDFTGTNLMKADFKAIAATSASDVWIAIGDHRLVHWDGAAWRHYPLEHTDAGGDRLMIAPSGKLWVIGRSMLLADTQTVAIFDGKRSGFEDGPEIPSNAHLRAIARQGDDVWVAGHDGAVLRSKAGATFQPVPVSDQQWSYDALWLDPAGSAGYLIGSGRLWRRSGNGFAPVEDEAHGETAAVCSSAGGEPAWIVGDRVLRYENGQIKEVAIDGFVPPPEYVASFEADRFESCDARAADDLWIVGRAGMILHHDGKALRELVPRFTEHDAIGVVWTGDDTWLAGFEDGALITGSLKAGITGHDRAPFDAPRAMTRTLAGEIVIAGCGTDMYARGAGGAWTKLPKLDGCVRAIAGTDKDHLWAVGSADLVDGKAWRLERGRWREVPTGMGKNDDMRDVAVAANGDVWIVGAGAVFVARGGGSLIRIARHKSDDYRGVAIRGPDDVWIANDTNVFGAGGALLHWDGKQLARFDPVAGNFLSSVAALPDGSVWAVGLGGVAAYSRDGKQFRAVQTDTAAHLTHVIARAPGTLIVVGVYGAILERDPPP